MDCREFQETILTVREADRETGLRLRIDEHRMRCAACAEFARREEGLSALLAGGAVTPAPSSFTGGVMSRIRDGHSSSPVSWLDWFLGPLRAPAPSFSMGHAAALAAVVIMLASAGVFVARGSNPTQGGAQQATLASAPIAAVAPAIDREGMDELIWRHQASSVMQPLSDDEGMRLVSY